LPHLVAGHVQLQVLPVCAEPGENSVAAADRELRRFAEWSKGEDVARLDGSPWGVLESARPVFTLALEGATALCDPEEPIDAGLRRLDLVEREYGHIFYLTLIRKGRSRFCGSSQTETGLEEDGRILIDYLDGRGIALDLAHSSARTSREVLEHIDRKRLDVPIIASHSNYRSVWNHDANLTDDVAREIARRGGLLGLNLIRAFVHDTRSDALYDHVEHALELGGAEALAFGADFFFWPDHPDRSRLPFFFAEHASAQCFPKILERIEARFGREIAVAIAHANALRFLERTAKAGATRRE
jgi:microsomal dipeptidase-like Zn-dependent dipeptidase